MIRTIYIPQFDTIITRKKGSGEPIRLGPYDYWIDNEYLKNHDLYWSLVDNISPEYDTDVEIVILDCDI